MEERNVIAIDGPAASGKSTIAKKLAEKLRIPYINTGNMYRAVTWAAIQEKLDFEALTEDKIQSLLSNTQLDYQKNQDGIFVLYMNGENVEIPIRSPEVVERVSQISAIPSVRDWLVAKQRLLAERETVVMEGRDIGTVVFPFAKNKFFLTATPEVRARRRLAQDGETVAGATVASVAAEITKRDELDSTRAVAPLCQAEDAFFVDSSEMNIDEVLDLISNRIV